jgi:hypothetical protein
VPASVWLGFHLGLCLQIVGRTRWPAAHDRVADLKQVISTLITVLREKVENLEDSMDTQNMRHMAPVETLPARCDAAVLELVVCCVIIEMSMGGSQ